MLSPLVKRVEVARQLALIEHEMYKKVTPQDLISQATKHVGKQKKERKKELMCFVIRLLLNR